MSELRRRGLQVDDPLSPRKPAPAASGPSDSPAASARRGPDPPGLSSNGAGKTSGEVRSPRRLTRRRAAAPQTRSAAAERGSWRSWSGRSRVASYRLPDELLDELAAVADEHRLPVGLLVAAAITHLLDHDLPTITALVDQADDARIHGRRNSRRRGPGDDAPRDHPDRGQGRGNHPQEATQ
jgi:hypothetical protein